MTETGETNTIDEIAEEGLFPDPLNTLMLNATIEEATDIHLHVVDGGTLILFRVDGIVHEKQRFSQMEGKRLINQLKAAADLNVSKSFSPQEGQLRWNDGEGTDKDIRVSIVPMGGQECAHLRILTIPENELDIARLGFSDDHRNSVSAALDRETFAHWWLFR
jgi:type IV pilus assembly protein PilB